MTERRVDVLVVRWYERRAHSPAVVPRWLAAARAHLPAALPVRFGDVEPLRGRTGHDDLEAAHAAADPLLFLAGSPPVHHASLAAGTRGGPTAVHSMQAELDPHDDAVHRFALALTHPDTVYVSASVESGLVLDGGTLHGPGTRPAEPYLAPRGHWLGLPPEPPAWCWFGPAYRRPVRRHVDAQETAGGLLRTGGRWVPERLRARLSEPDPARRDAPRRPRGL